MIHKRDPAGVPPQIQKIIAERFMAVAWKPGMPSVFDQLAKDLDDGHETVGDIHQLGADHCIDSSSDSWHMDRNGTQVDS